MVLLFLLDFFQTVMDAVELMNGQDTGDHSSGLKDEFCNGQCMVAAAAMTISFHNFGCLISVG